MVSELTKSRLLDLIAAVEALPAEHLDMKDWACGTQCCAVGAYCRAHPDRLPLKPVGMGYCAPKLGHLDSWSSILNHFEISDKDAIRFFSPSSYDGIETGETASRAVIARVRAFIGVVGEPEMVEVEANEREPELATV